MNEWITKLNMHDMAVEFGSSSTRLFHRNNKVFAFFQQNTLWTAKKAKKNMDIALNCINYLEKYPLLKKLSTISVLYLVRKSSAHESQLVVAIGCQVWCACSNTNTTKMLWKRDAEGLPDLIRCKFMNRWTWHQNFKLCFFFFSKILFKNISTLLCLVFGRNMLKQSICPQCEWKIMNM